MLPQFAPRQSSALHIDRPARGSAVIARVYPSSPSPDTTSRLSDLRQLAQRYNAMLDQDHAILRIAR